MCVVRIYRHSYTRKEGEGGRRSRSYSSHRVSAAMMNTVSKWESRERESGKDSAVFACAALAGGYEAES